MNEKIDSFLKLINDNLFNIYKKGPISLVDPISYVLNNPGKRIRPLLTLVVADAFQQDIDKDILNAAISVEMLHNFTLIHDDVMDDDEYRHGKLAVHCKWDKSTAILSGDALLSLALNKINEVENNHKQIMTAFATGLIAVCEGQALDIEFEQKVNIKKPQYEYMIKLKTGHLLGLASELGALSSNRNLEEIDKMREFGILLGKAFQIQDDLLEVESNKSRMGKSLGTDLLLQKKTYVLIKSLDIDKDTINSILELAKVDLIKARKKYLNFIKLHGIDVKIKNEIKIIINEAKSIINSLNIDTKVLHYFLKLISNRKV